MIRKALAALLAGPAAADLRVACCSGSNECEVTADLARRLMQANPGVPVSIDQVPFDADGAALPMLPASSRRGSRRPAPTLSREGCTMRMQGPP